MKKMVGIMGGTFDPIHLGHMLIAENAYETCNLDEVLFIPTGSSRLKESVLDAKTRAKMTGMAIEDNPHFAMSTIETEGEGYSYSYETIAELKRRYPETEYSLIVGADSFMNMEKWMCPEKIFSEVTILVASRACNSLDEINAKKEEYINKYGAKIKILPMKNVDFSSTDIRKMVNDGHSIRYLVHYKVVEFIEKNKLYRDEV